MNSILATEPTAPAEEKRPTLPPLETWSENERMRHIPTPEWMAQKVDGDVRSRINKMTAVFGDLASADPRYAEVETGLRALCTAIEQLAAIAGGRRNGAEPAAALAARIDAALTHAATSLRSLESTAFGRRHPYHWFDRSKAEPVYGALVAVICHIERLVPAVRAIDPEIE